MPLLPKTTLYGCAVLATLAVSLPQPRGGGKISLSLSLDAPSSVNNINDFIIAGKLKNEGTQDILVVKDPSGVLYDVFTADALVFERTDSKEKHSIKPSFTGYWAKWDIMTYLDDDLEEGDPHNDDTAGSRPNGRRASSDSESSSLSDDSHRLSHTDTGLTGFSGSESGPKKYPPGTTLALSAGETTTFNYKAGDVYDFSKSGTGAYTFELKYNFFYVLLDDELSEVKVNLKGSNTFKIQGKLKGGPKPKINARDIDDSDDVIGLKSSLVERWDTVVTTRNCGPRQTADIQEIADIANQYVAASNIINMYGINQVHLWDEWANRAVQRLVWQVEYRSPYEWRPRNQVAEMFASLSNHSFLKAGNAGGYTYDCGCQSDTTHAYIDAEALDPVTNPAIIWLCRGFRSRKTPVVGRNSRVGALVHEATHFKYHVPAGDDNAYGHTRCLDLAANKPFLAATNSDSYQYFVENYPFRA